VTAGTAEVEQLVRIHLRDDHAELETHAIVGGPGFTRSAGYELFCVEVGPLDGGGRPVWVAVLPDGHSYVLSDHQGFRAFLTATDGMLSWPETAALTAACQSEAAGPESLVVDRAAAAAGPLTPPVDLPADMSLTVVEQGEAWQLRFFTSYISQPDPDGPPSVAINQWTMGRDSDGVYWWGSRPVG
jgi:hypothetical protein